MSKAEDRAAKKALETFPILFSERNGYDKTNLQQERRNAYEKGYHQAEKDLELTWEHLKTLDDISDDVYAECDVEMFDEKEYYQEVLKRFKEKMMKDATEVTVHIDAGGYPYILQMELYDYDKDIPLAKEGDKYKVILIKEE